MCAFRNADLLGAGNQRVESAALLICVFRSPLDRVLRDTAMSIFGLINLGFTLATIPLLSAEENGPSLLLLLLLVVWCGDIAALYIGKSFGRRKLAPSLSPNKSWEGAIASVGGSLLITLGADRAGWPAWAEKR